MANSKAEFHGHLTRPGVKYDEEMSICLLESDLKMSKSHATNVVSFDEKLCVLFVDLNELIWAKGTIFMNETAIELTGQTLAPLMII